MSVQPDRLQKLRDAKLFALVRGYLAAQGRADAVALTQLHLAGGAALRAADELWVYVAGETERALGRALLLATRDAPAALHLVLDSDNGHDARRAAVFVLPVHVWCVDGTALVPAVAVPLASPADPPAGPAPAALVAMLESAGVEVVVEHGVIVGEVRGLEVARVRVDPHGEVSLDVGVGRFDQEAGALLHGDQPNAVALGRAADLIRGHRRAGAAPHAVNRLARERWLRAQLIEDPALVGLDSLAPVSPPLPRRNVKDPAPAAAVGHEPHGLVLVICTMGVDLEWVPVAADLIQRERPTRVVVALPRRDLLPAQGRLAALLPVPVQFVAVEGGWPV